MIQDLVIFKQYYQKAAKVIPRSSFYYGTLNHKFKHSIDVLNIGKDILFNTPELAKVDENFIDFAQKALLFHDVGRFKEAVNRYRREAKGLPVFELKTDHGLRGYNLMKKTPPYDNMKILFALRYHGKMMEQILHSSLYKKIAKLAEKEDIMKILYLVRDADKMANLYRIKNDGHLKEDIFYRNLNDSNRNDILSDNVKQQFLKKQVILSPTLRTYADRILQVLSWIFDLNYIRTKQIFVEQEYDKFLIDELTKYHHSAIDLQTIAKLTQEILRKN